MGRLLAGPSTLHLPLTAHYLVAGVGNVPWGPEGRRLHGKACRAHQGRVRVNVACCGMLC